MKKLLLLLFLLIFISPAFAAGNLTVTTTNMAPVYVNTRALTNMLNITFNSTIGDINVTAINVTINGSAVVTNISVSLLNSTGAVIVSNSTNSTVNTFTLYPPGGIAVYATNKTIIIAINVSAKNSTTNSVSIFLNGTGEIGTNESIASNISMGPANSSFSQIHDVHAIAYLSPLFVDTNILNQTLVYNINVTGSDGINSTVITVPSGYALVNVSDVNISIGSCMLTGCSVAYAVGGSQINVSSTTPLSSSGNPLRVFFTVNTSSSTSGIFTSNITGSNITNVNTDFNVSQINVTTQQLLTPLTVVATKNVVIVNGTDYWQFQFNVNVTQPVSGLLQFRMNDWNMTSSTQGISLSGCSTSCASLSDTSDFSSANKFNITNNYVSNQGLNYTGISGVTSIFLRMIVPTGTPISPSWFTTYYMAFRSS